RCARSAPPLGRSPPRPTTYATSCRAAPSPRAITTLSPTSGCAASAASISPSSTRKPRTFTCSSTRPTHSTSPSLTHPPRSPHPRPVHPPPPRPPRTAPPPPPPPAPPPPPRSPPPPPPPPTHSPPPTPTGTGCRCRSSTYPRMSVNGRPSGLPPPRSTSA